MKRKHLIQVHELKKITQQTINNNQLIKFMIWRTHTKHVIQKTRNY